MWPQAIENSFRCYILLYHPLPSLFKIKTYWTATVSGIWEYRKLKCSPHNLLNSKCIWEDKKLQKKQYILGVTGFLGGSDGTESACNAGDLGSIPGSGRSPGGVYFCILSYNISNGLIFRQWNENINQKCEKKIKYQLPDLPRKRAAVLYFIGNFSKAQPLAMKRKLPHVQ